MSIVETTSFAMNLLVACDERGRYLEVLPMRHDIHLAALRAAARVAFATTVLVGCSGSADESSETAGSNLDTTASCDDAAASAVNDAADAAADAPSTQPLGDAGRRPCCWMTSGQPELPCTDFGPACTPWGPPVPPAMRAAA